MDLYKIISQLTEDEFQEIHSNFTDNNAEKSASFLRIIRENPESPDKQFLEEFNVNASAFYVLKSRLNQRVETFLLNRIGDPSLHVMRRVLSVNDLVFNNPREISIAALRRLEKELLRFDFPFGLMIVYKELQNLHAFDEDNYTYYQSRYNQQVAYSVAMDKGVDLVVQFFRAYDNFYLSRKDKDYNEMIRIMEKVDNLNNLYDSHRLFMFKAIIHVFGMLFLEIPKDIRCELSDIGALFEKSFEILDKYKGDTFYENINILFNFLRYVYYDNEQVADRSKMYFDFLDYKIEEMLTRYHFNAPTSLFLFRKLQYHRDNNTLERLLRDTETYINKVEVSPYRTSLFVNFHLFQAYAYFYNKNYKKASRILFNLRHEVNLRKNVHMNLEVRFFLTLSYVMMEDFDLANQLILSLQRQLRKTSMDRYNHCKILLKILSVALGGKPRTRIKNLKVNIEKWNQENKGRYAILTNVDMKALFLKGEFESGNNDNGGLAVMV
ncbi:MAG: hypothetical protein AAGI38_01335 [Bacteroidota bacterium]